MMDGRHPHQEEVVKWSGVMAQHVYLERDLPHSKEEDRPQDQLQEV